MAKDDNRQGRLTVGGRLAGDQFVAWRHLHVPRDAQALEGVFRLVVHRAASALGRTDRGEFLDDLVDGLRLAIDRESDADLAQRAIALAVLREIQRHDGNALALDVAPDVELGPM